MKTMFTKIYCTLRQNLLGGLGLLLVSLCSTLSPVKAQTVYAVTSASQLISFSATAPATVLSTTALTGTLAGHSIEGLDFRPATGQLYSFSYNPVNGEAQVYRVKIGTGVMTPVGAPITLALGMSSIGFDFNPTVDRIRVTSATRQNYRLVPDNGTIAFTDGQLTYAAGDANAAATPNIRAAAYTNSFAGTTTTTLYYYDFNLNILASTTLPNNGTLNTVGGSGIVAAGTSGTDLDILTNTSTGTNSAYLLAGVGGNSNFYTVNLTSGAATIVGAIGSGLNVTDMAIVINPPAVNKLIYGISAGNLISFYSNAPATILGSVALSGITAGQTLVGLDFRPATGQLFAMGYVAASGLTQLYTINLTTGVATAVGAASTLALNMTGIGFDFNPTVDRIRVTSSTRQNYRLNPNDGTIAFTDGNLTYAVGDVNAAAMPVIHAVGYTNSYAGATTTVIYYYDVALNILASSTVPNTGAISTIGSTGIVANTTTAEVDMDISSNQGAGTNAAFVLASTNGTSSNLYTLNTATGVTTSVGAIGAGILVSEMAIFIPSPAPVKNVYAIQGNNLINFSTSNPGNILSSVAITGITVGQSLVGLDFRPATGQLYAMGYTAASGSTQVYTVNLVSGAATAVGAAVILATNMTGIGFDFNPTVDRIRVTSSSRKNYRLNPIDGTIAGTDTDLTYAVTDANATVLPDIQGVAYTNSLPGATTTTIYYYDYTLDNLATSAAPNGGILNTVGRSGLIANTATGLDLEILTDQSTSQNTAFLSANVSGNTSNFYLVNLATGEAYLIGAIGGAAITKMAVSSLDVILPVTVTDFTVKKEGRTSKLNWVTKSEINNAGFVIERSSNGVNFKPLSANIGSKALGGNSTLSLNYDYTDIIPAKGVNFYRLLQVDKDGTKKYSNILQLQFDDVAAIKMYPNPTPGLVTLSANIYNNATLSIRVSDVTGKSVRSYQYKVSEGVFNTRINLAGLQSGMYYVTIADDKNFKYQQAIQKQ